MKKTDIRHNLLDFNLFSSSKSQVLKICADRLAGAESRSAGQRVAKTVVTGPLVIFTPNSEQLVQAYHDISFVKTLGMADILLPDGAGVVWAARLLSKTRGGAMAGTTKSAPALPNRIAGVDVVDELLKLAETNNQKVLIVGGRGYDELIFKKQLFWHSGYDQVARPTPEEEKTLMSYIAKLRPELVFVAFGAPHQENWVQDHLELLKSSGVRIVMVVGGAFDILLGKAKRAPVWMQSAGLEWLFRLISEPWRWKRQLRLVEFVGLVAKTWLNQK
jgi:N-acetylglucosaminyldiphosphoundecaprenol N-acetyl-beta-D-mannosaminyltransferase